MTRKVLCGLALICVLAPAPAPAQSSAPSSRLVTAVTTMARLGYEVEFDAFVVGGAVRVPMLRLPFEVQAAYDLTFLDVFTERQLALDALWRAGAGLYLGGGVVFRNSRYPMDAAPDELGPRESRTGYSLVVQLGGAPSPDASLITGLELRWIWVDVFTPRTILAQIGVPLLRF